MSRAPLKYDRPARAPGMGTGYSVEAPTPGFYRYKMTSGGHPVGVRIWLGPQLDPLDGSPLDRWDVWQASVNDQPVELDRVWPACGREPIDQREHDYLASVQAWAATNAPDSPQADPRRKIDLLTAPLPL